MGFGKELLILGLLGMLGQCVIDCHQGQNSENDENLEVDMCSLGQCEDQNSTSCLIRGDGYNCTCKPGYKHTLNKTTFAPYDGQCQDHNECIDENKNPCSPHGTCKNQIGNFTCNCYLGYVLNGTSRSCEDRDECAEAEAKEVALCGPQGVCNNTDGSYWCRCSNGFTNYGNQGTPCSKLDCDGFNTGSSSHPPLPGLVDITSMMRNNCLILSKAGGEVKGDGETLLEKVFTAIESVLSSGPPGSAQSVSHLLTTMENAVRLIGPQLKHNRTKLDTTETVEAEIAVQRGARRPTGPIHLTTENATVVTDWATAAGTGSYPGFALAALLSYKNLDISLERSFEELRRRDNDSENRVFQVFSRVVSVVVSNPSTENLRHPVQITLRHLKDINESTATYTCAYWSESGTWSPNGCHEESTNATHTVCNCSHLSSFAVLMALTPMEHTFGLRLVTRIGLAVSLLCLVLSILTFKFCRSIQGTRTTIHLHLCICLFLADLFFLAGISQTSPVGGCRFVAAMLHFFFLAVFAWMFLEGVQLYRMVVQVFNATIRPLYLFATGYGMPLVIVIISVSVRTEEYGTKDYCWLSLKEGLIWSFFGPVCVIIILNAFFFIITVWKLAQKFTSLNPDLTSLHKIKAFTVTAIAQMCILGLMWVFGAFLFEKDAIVVAYIFTILNSLQGALVFVMHCLLSKQVRDEYAHFLSCICTSQKKRYSDFSSTNPSSSQSQASRSRQHTGQSQI
ncbi:CD97 antigen-like isoform X1 [Takifugu rubripes]|uniref:CD97 antigen-like isoform X1 n=1 Tax=Takifugu rubripes TaxID=31033 RepID=UPI0011454703|nr:CD97 antigen-like isoform X1 [Takifugu rubripes]